MTPCAKCGWDTAAVALKDGICPHCLRSNEPAPVEPAPLDPIEAAADRVADEVAELFRVGKSARLQLATIFKYSNAELYSATLFRILPQSATERAGDKLPRMEFEAQGANPVRAVVGAVLYFESTYRP